MIGVDDETRQFLVRIEQKVDRIYLLSRILQTTGEIMANELDQLEQRVTAQGTVIDSAVTLLAGLKQALDDAITSGDMARVQAVSDQIEVKTQALAAAVQTNTPAAGGGGGPAPAGAPRKKP